jgi:hypothetical protein
MPEFAERRSFLGIRKAESQWDRYVRERVLAEHDSVKLVEQLEESARLRAAANREKEQAVRG